MATGGGLRLDEADLSRSSGRRDSAAEKDAGGREGGGGGY
jgi:hypothetical protein